MEKAENKTAPAYFCLAIAVLLGVVGVLIARSSHVDIPLVGLSFWRWFVAALLLFPFVRKDLLVSHHKVLSHWKLFVLQGLFIVGGGTLMFYALNYTPAINVSVINTTQPVLTTLIAVIFLHQKLSAAQTVGVLLAVLGMGVIVTQADLEILFGLQFNMGDLLVVCAMICFSIYAVNIAKVPKEINDLTKLFVIVFCGSLTIFPFYVAESIYDQPFPITFSSVINVLVLAVFVSISSVGLWTYGNSIVGPSRAAIFVNLTPIYGIGLAVLFLNEKFYGYHLLGALLICSGIVAVVGVGQFARKSNHGLPE